MKIKVKFTSFFILALTFILISSTFHKNVQAVTTNTSDINLIAENSPEYLMPQEKASWKNVSIIDKIPLYNFNNKLISYSFDLRNEKTGEKAYVIISLSEDDGPILEFGIGKYSPYYNMNNTGKKAIYTGVAGYYSNENGEYYDIGAHAKLTSKEEALLSNSSKSKKYISSNPNKSKIERHTIESNTQNTKITSNAVVQHSLPVPDYEWYEGCAPTAAGMVVKYDFSSALSNASADTVINQLANAMGTDSNGSTTVAYIPEGIEATMAKYNVPTDCSNDGYGTSNSTFSKYESEINNNHPVIVNVLGSTETAPSYPNGFGNHSMAGCGYIILSGVHYLVTRDTGCDGYVLCNYDSSALGTPCWTYVDAD